MSNHRPAPQTIGKTDPIDKSVGRNIRYYRNMRKLSQQQVAAGCGVKFQQLQKYESGANRVSASKLVLIARALNVPVADLFSGVETISAAAPRSKTQAEWDGLYPQLPETFRRRLMSLARAMATS
jgi:transcriptional regulator with XRE-family HTH domain